MLQSPLLRDDYRMSKEDSPEQAKLVGENLMDGHGGLVEEMKEPGEKSQDLNISQSNLMLPESRTPGGGQTKDQTEMMESAVVKPTRYLSLD